MRLLPQDVGGDIHGGHTVPISRLARDQLQVTVLLDRLGEALDALARVGRTGLPFNLSDLAAVWVKLVQEFRRRQLLLIKELSW